MLRTKNNLTVGTASDGSTSLFGSREQASSVSGVGDSVSISQLSKKEKKAHKELASASGGGLSMGLPSGSSTANIQSPQAMMPLLDGFYIDHAPLVNRLYREIYHCDPVCGSAIDLLSTLPFGDFVLTGMNDERRLQKFAESVEAMRIRQLLPSLSVDFLVFGKFVATLGWDDARNIFTTVCPQNIDFLAIESLPIYNADPVIRLSLPPNVLKMINSDRPEIKKALSRLPADVMEALTGNGAVLDSDRTIFIARQGMVQDYQGVSLLKRILPIWLTEKALIRGSLDQFWKRQRAIMHVTIGDDAWEPTVADFQQVNDLLLAADHDPTGAIITTRQSVNINEVRRGDDMLKHSDLADYFERLKLRGLGVGDLLQSGDASLAATEGSISVMLQFFDSYRNMITREVFYDKVFPAIALANGYRRSQSIVLGSDGHTDDPRSPFNSRGMRRSLTNGLEAEFAADLPRQMHGQSMSKYSMPKVKFMQSLKPDGTGQFMDLLEKMEAHGVPIPLRMWAVSSGLTLDQLAEEMDNDIKARKHFKKWRKLIGSSSGDPSSADLGDGSGGEEEESSIDLAVVPPGTGSVGYRPPLLKREFDPDKHGVYQERNGGKRYPVSSRKARQINERANRMIASSIREQSKAHNKKQNEEYRQTAFRKFYRSVTRG